ncbi:MAG: hypothetical protein AAGG69_00745 [Pseudomonadota bacterium]
MPNTSTLSQKIADVCDEIDAIAKTALKPHVLKQCEREAIDLQREASVHVAKMMGCADKCRHRTCRDAGLCQRPLLTVDGKSDGSSCLAQNGRQWAQARAEMFRLVCFSLRFPFEETDSDAR